jgi:tRNA A37 methylthiotransferase MiaB
MREIENRFGKGKLIQMTDIVKNHGTPIYCFSTACMSVTSDMISWISAGYVNQLYLTTSPSDANTIIILGCQVTDLAILNDIRTAEWFHRLYPEATILMGGCLSQRFDIELPDFIQRLDVAREQYQPLDDNAKEYVDWQKPFWVPRETWINDAVTGRLFRDMYPLKIGAGCHGLCKYCTIRDTRGEAYETDAYLQVKEFLDHKDVVLISDSPSSHQIIDWCSLALRYKKPISFRNVEPHVALDCDKILLTLAKNDLLKIFHCPIQSNDSFLLREMGRNAVETELYIEFAQKLRSFGTYVATNIIIDYEVDGKLYNRHSEELKEWMNAHFDYWVWNPYFDGKWDRAKAEKRFKEYIG